MGKTPDRDSPDRHLTKRAGVYQYKRRVPKVVAHLDDRAPHVRLSLGTDDRALARTKRDMLEAADDALWASLIVEDPVEAARERHKAAMRRVEALGFTFRTADSLSDMASMQDIARRFELLVANRFPAETERSVAGMIDAPVVSVSRAFVIYCDEIVPDELLGKSAHQKAQWRKVKQRAVNNFIALAGDKAMTEINRDDALRLYNVWRTRIAPRENEGKPTHSASSGNRDIGNMRVLYDAYFTHIGEVDRPNPFAKLNFLVRKKKRRPPFPTEWIRDHILRPGALAGLNDEARGILLIMVETGARPSEICNLSSSTIRLTHKVPHLAIEPSDDPDDPREIKTESSERKVPLVGVALAAAQRHATGFPRYRNRENDLSATLNKFLKTNGLFPSRSHKVYSLRHSFEDRMKNAGLDDELRRIVMGHAIDRPQYGSGGSLEWRRDELTRLVLPYDPSIV